MTPFAEADQPAEHLRRLRRRAMLQLSTFFGVLLLVMLGVVLGGVIDLRPSELRDTLRETGALAPLVFIVVSGVLSSLFVPGPVFALAGGL